MTIRTTRVPFQFPLLFHAFDEFETDSLNRLRQYSNQQLTRISSSVFSDGVRLIAPVIT
jgi:hypothetical protein